MFEKLLKLNQEEIKEAKTLAKQWMDEFTYDIPHNGKTHNLELLSDALNIGGITPNDYYILLVGYALAKPYVEPAEAMEDVE